MTAMEKIEATPLAMKIIAGLLVAIITLGSAWAVNVNSKLEQIIEVNSAQDRQIFTNTETLRERKTQYDALQTDVREIRQDVKTLLERK